MCSLNVYAIFYHMTCTKLQTIIWYQGRISQICVFFFLSNSWSRYSLILSMHYFLAFICICSSFSVICTLDTFFLIRKCFVAWSFCSLINLLFMYIFIYLFPNLYVTVLSCHPKPVILLCFVYMLSIYFYIEFDLHSQTSL